MSTEPGQDMSAKAANSEKSQQEFPDIESKNTNVKGVKILLKKLARNSVMPVSMDTAVQSSLGPPSSVVTNSKQQVG